MISYAPALAIRQYEAKQFITATADLASLELEYGQPGQAQLLSQMLQTWKEPHIIRLGQLVEGCTPEYTVWRRQKIEDAVPLPNKMQVPILDPIPVQPLEIEIIQAEFASERLEMKQKYLKLQEIADKAESNAQIHEHKV